MEPKKFCSDFSWPNSNNHISLYSVHRRNLEQSKINNNNDLRIDTSNIMSPSLWTSQRRPLHVQPSPASSVMGVVGSETRRLLRELDRRNSPIAAARRMRLENNSTMSSPRSTADSEISSPSSSALSMKPPPLSSLVTPYRAHVLPRLATLVKTPYSRPQKQTAEKGVETDLSVPMSIISPTLQYGDKTEHHNNTTGLQRQVSLAKSTSKLKVVGGGRNRFTAHNIDDEPEVLYDNKYLNRLPRITLNSAPVAGFLSGLAGFRSETKNVNFDECPASPTSDIFHFSSPIVVQQRSCEESAMRNWQNSFLAPKPTAPENNEQMQVSGFRPNFGTVENTTTTGSTVVAPVLFSENLTLRTAANVASLPKKTWSCSTCFVNNKVEDSVCICCKAQKPAATNLEIEKQKPESSTNWTCNECWIKNPSTTTTCVACGYNKLGKDAVDSKFDTLQPKTTFESTFPKTTWSCTTCFISNGAEKMKCQACQSPKPGVDFKPVNFGIKPTVSTTAQSSSTIGVQCTPPPVTVTIGVSPPLLTNGPSSMFNSPALTTTSGMIGALKTEGMVPTTGFSFGIKPAESTPATNAEKAETAKATFSFGIKAAEISAQALPKVAESEQTDELPTKRFNFGAKSTEPVAPFSKSQDAPKPFTFGIPSSDLSKNEIATSKPSLSFGFGSTEKPANKDETAPKPFTFSAAETSSSILGLGAFTTSKTDTAAASQAFSFGLKPAETSSKESAIKIDKPSSFAFNAQPSGSSSGFQFAPSVPPTTTSGLGPPPSAAPTSSSSGFTFAPPTVSASTVATGFNFGPVPTTTSAAAAAPSSGFQFNFTTAQSGKGAAASVGGSTTSATSNGGFAFGLGQQQPLKLSFQSVAPPLSTSGGNLFQAAPGEQQAAPGFGTMPTFGAPAATVGSNNMFSIAKTTGPVGGARKMLKAKRKALH